jgi:hypothetical protein
VTDSDTPKLSSEEDAGWIALPFGYQREKTPYALEAFVLVPTLVSVAPVE